MSAATYLSKSAFAAHIGRSPSYITWLKENSRLVLSPNGKQVEVLASEALIRDTAIRARPPSLLATNRSGFSVMSTATSQRNPSPLSWMRRRPLIQPRYCQRTFRKHERIENIIWRGWRNIVSQSAGRTGGNQLRAEGCL